MKKSRLSRFLSRIDDFEEPKVSLEQYITPPQLAADILHAAYMNNDIEGRKVADLGTGTGILAIGAALMGAEVTAFEKDEDALEQAKENAEEMEVDIEFVQKDVEEVDGKFDTVVMNPPFSVHSDIGIDFMEKAVSISNAVYTVSHPGSRKAIKDFVASSKHKVRTVEEYSISLPATFGFHKQEGRETDVDVLVTTKQS